LLVQEAVGITQPTGQSSVVELNSIISNALDRLRILAGDKISLKALLSSELGAVRASAEDIEGVITNLVSNARDAMPTGGRITIETQPASAEAPEGAHRLPDRGALYAMLSVTDTGVGIDEDTKARIFEPFFTTKGPRMGTGLGLSVSQGIVRQNGGFMKVDSVKGKGSTVKTYLPMVRKQDWRVPRPSMNEGRLVRGTVLLVDDEAGIRALGKRVLEDIGYDVIEASDGQTALALASQHEGRLDLLISDVVMPDISGADLLAKISITRPGLRVLFISGLAEDPTSVGGTGVGATRFLSVPVSTEELAKKLRAAVATPEL
jgi:CheY-like chemotaxis protein